MANHTVRRNHHRPYSHYACHSAVYISRQFDRILICLAPALPGARQGFCSLFQIKKIGMTACAKSVDLAAKRASQTDLLFFISILLNWLLPLSAQRFQLRAQIVRRVIAAKGLRRLATGNIGQLNALCHRAAVVHAKHQPGQEIIPCPGLIHRCGLPCREVLRLAVSYTILVPSRANFFTTSGRRGAKHTSAPWRKSYTWASVSKFSPSPASKVIMDRSEGKENTELKITGSPSPS